MGRPKVKVKEKGLDKTFNSILYVYVQKENSTHANQMAKMFGSKSAYINTLIANDRGAKPELGKWKAEGESKAIREASKDPKPLEKPEPFTPMGPPGTAGYRDPVI